MASFGFGPRRHLDADAGREVVYCHSCTHEWYKDDQPPTPEPECPRCHSEIVEIVEPGANDPRIEAGIAGLRTPSDIGGGSGLFFRRNAAGSDSDPEEDDIENHIRGGPARSPFGRGFFPPTPGAPDGDDNRAENEVFNRFFELVFQDLGGGRVLHQTQRSDSPGPGAAPSPPGRHVHTTTFTFVSGPGARPEQPNAIPPLFGPYVARPPPRHHHHHRGPHRTVTFVTRGNVANVDPFNRMLGQLLRGAMMAGPQDPNQPGNRAAGSPPMGAGGFGLQQLLATILNPAAAVHGDAVFTQEALDRIITQLMETSPQTNAAPPASESAIESLEKKKVDAELLGPEGKAECTICIDEFKLGDEVTVLPCSHWYHGECVVLWLKEHNTCPICRKPIENQENNNNNRSGNNSGQRSPAADQAGSSSSQAQQPQRSQNEPSRLFGSPPSWTQPSSRPDEGGSGSTSSYQSPFFSYATTRIRTPQENQERLDRIRSMAGQRRSSVSPPGAWPEDDNTDSRSSRQRSPSRPREETWGERGLFGGGNSSGSDNNNRRSYFSSFTSSGRDQQQQQQREGSSSSGNNNNGNGGSSGGSSNPLTWLRDHFSRDRNNGNGNGSDRDRRR
ncbi:hypothetical protein B0T21DRAFT_283611 [Apiosordaria backusii]|uniref:RING-type E3 ubiquitin transferase n=1 Tax=Apiosordaria backusii TaxID=314023 RepID=A0AA40EMV4_9PEZI|nr:hypothetical protein B0T21DRAFT_283611 [Apiosordaria backusii]